MNPKRCVVFACLAALAVFAACVRPDTAAPAPDARSVEASDRLPLPAALAGKVVTCFLPTADGGFVVAASGGLFYLDSTGALVGETALDALPSLLAMDADGAVYAACEGDIFRVEAADRAATLFASLGSESRLTSLAVREGRLYAADAVQETVYVFSLEGRLERILGFEPALELACPFFDLGFADDGSLLVPDVGTHVLHRYDARGALLDSVALYGDASGAAPADSNCAGGCCDHILVEVLPGGAALVLELGVKRLSLVDGCALVAVDLLPPAGAIDAFDLAWRDGVLSLLTPDAIVTLRGVETGGD